MKTIKKTTFYATLTLLVIKNLYPVKEHMFERASKVIAEGVVDATKILSDASVEGAKGIGIEATKIVSDAGIEATKILKEGAVKSSEQVGLAAAKQLTPYIGAAICIYGLKQVADAGIEVYAYNFPSEEKTAKINEAREKNSFYDAKRNLRTCLLNNGKTQKNSSGIPVACEELGRIFTVIGGQSQFEEMKENFKTAFGE